MCFRAVYEVNEWDFFTISVILLVYGLGGALSVSILLSVAFILSHVVLYRFCKTGDTTLNYNFLDQKATKTNPKIVLVKSYYSVCTCVCIFSIVVELFL